jgi:hypothetical protein
MTQLRTELSITRATKDESTVAALLSPPSFDPDTSPSEVATPDVPDNPQPKSFSLTMLHVHPSSHVIRLIDDKSVSIKVNALPSPLDVYIMVDLSTYSADMLNVC